MANAAPKELIVGGKRIKLTPASYVAAGGEATIYKHGNQALRVYHDRTAMPPKDRLDELARITLANVVKPIEIIEDAATGQAIGFSMAFVTDTEPLCRFFTQVFRKKHNISAPTIYKLTMDIQETVRQLIAEGFLPVDLNELNILASMVNYVPWFIDNASWATPKFPATAIMDSVRDPLVKGNAFTAGSTWYSFGVLATQLFLGIHPFHGLHPKYKMDWKKRMVENASIFEPGVKVPAVVPPFSTVPPAHLAWMKRIFGGSVREAPPMFGAAVPLQVTPAAARIVNASGAFKVDNWLHAPEQVIDVYTGLGRTYVVSSTTVYCVEGDSYIRIVERSKYRQALVLQLNVDEVVVALINPGTVEFIRHGHNGVGNNLVEVYPLRGGMFARNGRFYSVSGNMLMEHEFMKLSTKVTHMERHVDNVNDNTTKVFDGVVYQDLFGKAWLTVPFAAGSTVSKHVPVLDGYRVLDAKCRGNICVVVAEKSNLFSHFILVFDEAFDSFEVRVTPDQRELNFTVTQSGICVMFVDGALELFKNLKAPAKRVENPPIDASTTLVSTHTGVYFIDGTDVQKLSVQ